MSNPKAPADPVETPSIDARLVRKLADILKDTGLSEIEVEHAGLKIRVARELTAAPRHLRPGPAGLRRSGSRRPSPPRSPTLRPPRRSGRPRRRATW
jgi:acetyl-CoA carboxylase biotin carboxyl carrier protein